MLGAIIVPWVGVYRDRQLNVHWVDGMTPGIVLEIIDEEKGLCRALIGSITVVASVYECKIVSTLGQR